MGLTFRLGQVPLAIFTDSSNNVGIGANPISSTKFYVLGNTTNYGITSENPSGYGGLTLKQISGNSWSLGVTSNNLFFYDANGGATRMTLTGAGNVGIGTSSPALTTSTRTTLDIGNASESILVLSTGGSWRSYFYNDGTNLSIANSGGFINFDVLGERMRITNTGNVGIGTSSPSFRLHILASSATMGMFATSSASGGFVGFRYNTSTTFGYIGNGNQLVTGGGVADMALTSESGNILFANNSGTERMRITGGDLLIGTTSNVGQRLRVYQPSTAQWNVKLIQPDGSSQLFQEFLTTTDNDATNTARGSIRYNGTNVLYLGTSDYRLKEDLRDYNALGIISQLKTYDFKWKEAGTRDFGMMAHELQEVLPNYVTGVKDELNEDGSINPQQVDYSKLIPVLVKSIQELNAKVTALENR